MWRIDSPDRRNYFSRVKAKRVVSFRKSKYRLRYFFTIYKFWPAILNAGFLITRTLKNTVCFVQRAWHKYVTNRYEFQDMTATCSSMSDFSRCPRNVEYPSAFSPHCSRSRGCARNIKCNAVSFRVLGFKVSESYHHF